MLGAAWPRWLPRDAKRGQDGAGAVARQAELAAGGCEFTAAG